MKEQQWPHRNHPAAIARRQEVLRARTGWQEEDERIFRWSVPTEGLAPFQECLTGEMVLPVGVVGPLEVELGRYHMEPDGRLVEEGRTRESVFIPLAHTEGGLSASMLRGMRAASAAGGIRTYVLGDRMTRDSAFVFAEPRQAVALAAWAKATAPDLIAWINDPDNPLRQERDAGGRRLLSAHARLHEIESRVVGPVCHLLYRFTTGDACGPNMITRNSYVLNREIAARIAPLGLEPRHIFLEANLGGDKKPSYAYYAGGHGKTVVAETVLPVEVIARQLHVGPEDLERLEWTGIHGAHASGMQSFGFTPASAVAAIFAATGQDLGMVGTSSMAHGTLNRTPDGGIAFSIELGGVEVGTVGGGTGLPHARSYLRLMGCEGPGSAYRLAQLVGAAVLALEISASASMASHGSENFFRAHWQRGGVR
ncbi:Hydroxymethylglutaryl-CoA reductase [Candidatus Hydrogenisulfobacillus filiaventi]|uniref:Hydroxymethylglutaryl-CoA reductase n=1 Tax=Candidatus Hydrogenisulfobacillus filiaventi TaxID=2707344 RepID=A0A6F8ZL03_9FIRM|nr:Hydroxymethylglutaryl-CoA reductase [Candidatus Hydrogenisulfobacillus filiaventi]